MKLKSISSLITCCLLCACGLIPDVHIWLQSVDFEVDPKANNEQAFECHITIAYSKDLLDRLQGMDAQGYFTSADSLQKTYKDSIEIFSFDMIPGKNKEKQKISLKSYNKALGAFIFAKYSTSGKFAENIGSAKSIVVKFLPHKMEVVSDSTLESLTNKVSILKN